MNFPRLSKPGSEHLGHPWPSMAILCQASRRQVASLLASALERLVHRAFHAWHTAKAGDWAVLEVDIPTFQGQALVCITAMILLFTYIYIYMTYIYTSSSSSLRGIRSCHVLSFTSVGWTPHRLFVSKPSKHKKLWRKGLVCRWWLSILLIYH